MLRWSFQGYYLPNLLCFGLFNSLLLTLFSLLNMLLTSLVATMVFSTSFWISSLAALIFVSCSTSQVSSFQPDSMMVSWSSIALSVYQWLAIISWLHVVCKLVFNLTLVTSNQLTVLLVEGIVQMSLFSWSCMALILLLQLGCSVNFGDVRAHFCLNYSEEDLWPCDESLNLIFCPLHIFEGLLDFIGMAWSFHVIVLVLDCFPTNWEIVRHGM